MNAQVHTPLAAAEAAPEVTPALPLDAHTRLAAGQTPRDAPAEPALLIEPGRALALADFAGPALGPVDRLVRLAYSLGVPGATLSAPLRRPARPRLLATVESPTMGDKVAGTALRAGHFLIHGLKLPIAQTDFAAAARLAPPVDRVVHGFTWLADLQQAAPREAVTSVADRITGLWLTANGKAPSRAGSSRAGGAWTVGNAGQRLLHWLVYAPLVLSSPDKAARARLLATIADTARWLDRNVTRAEDRLGATLGWAAITAAGLLLPDGRPRRIFGEAGLVRAIGELLGDDGGVLSRSPLAQMEAIAALIRLNACYRATRSPPPPAITAALELMVPPLLALTHGDGGLANWQGGWAVSADVVAALVAASGIRTRPLRDARAWGYQRVSAGKAVLIVDAAPPPLARQARFGCASTLAFEFSHAGQRVIVNCGGAAAAGGLMPLRLEQGLRATAAHSTLVLDDTNSTSVLLNGQIGYTARFGLTHRRIVILREDGSELRGEDVLVPSGRRGKRGKVGFALRFHLGPGVEVAHGEDERGVGLAMPDGSWWQFRSGGGAVSIEESLWADGDGRPVPVQQLVIQGMVSRGGGNFAWLLKKMG